MKIKTLRDWLDWQTKGLNKHDLNALVFSYNDILELEDIFDIKLKDKKGAEND